MQRAAHDEFRPLSQLGRNPNRDNGWSLHREAVRWQRPPTRKPAEEQGIKSDRRSLSLRSRNRRLIAFELIQEQVRQRAFQRRDAAIQRPVGRIRRQRRLGAAALAMLVFTMIGHCTKTLGVLHSLICFGPDRSRLNRKG